MIVVDVQALQSEAFADRGIGRYVAELTAATVARHPGLIDAVLWNDQRPITSELERLEARISGVPIRSFSDVRGMSVDVLHVSAPFDLLDARLLAVPVRARRTVVTCYDLIPFVFPDVYLADLSVRARYLTRLQTLLAADAVLADSQSAANDLVDRLGVNRQRITVIGGGVGPQFVAASGDEQQRMARLQDAVAKIEPGFVLVPTGIDWRKNIERTLAAYAALPELLRGRHQLVLACKVDDTQRRWLGDLAAELGIGERLLITGHVPDDVLVLLYQSCSLVVFASLYEGFGLPVAEARRCGARVICSRSSALPEVLASSAAWFDPWDVADIARVLERALTDERFGAELDAIADTAGSWHDTADRAAGVYRALAEPIATSASDRPPRLAVVTPLPPAPTGIADHSRRLVAALDAVGIDVVVFTDGDAIPIAGLAMEPIAALPTAWHAGRFDAVLYCIGNNPLHRRSAAMQRVVPGHVLLHDVRLSWLFGESDDVLCTERVTDFAVSVLVQSQHARQMVADATGVDAINVGPHPCVQGVATDPIDDGRPLWVVSAGVAHESKLPQIVVPALAELASTGDARTALVGVGGERFVAAGQPVVVTGRVDDDEFDRWLRTAAVLVQLRADSNGESSGVAAHAMARGVPMVVTDIGAMAELPEQAAARVAVDIASDELVAELRALLADDARRDRMRAAGLAFAAEQTPEAQARRIVAAVFPDFAARRGQLSSQVGDA